MALQLCEPHLDDDDGDGDGDRHGLAAAVWAALDTVLDPELDEPVTDLGFVTEASVDPDGDVRVRLRLPTAFCSPSFAYLMASDAADAIRALSGVRRLTLTLDDHSDSAAVNAGIAAGHGFAAAFPAETQSELHALREVFRRKAHQAYVERVCSTVLPPDAGAGAFTTLTLADLPPGRLAEGLRRRRADLDLPLDADAPVCVDEVGTPWPAEQVERRLRFARAVRVSIDGNAHFCRGLLATRYPGSEADQSTRQHELLTIAPSRSAR